MNRTKTLALLGIVVVGLSFQNCAGNSGGSSSENEAAEAAEVPANNLVGIWKDQCVVGSGASQDTSIKFTNTMAELSIISYPTNSCSNAVFEMNLSSPYKIAEAVDTEGILQFTKLELKMRILSSDVVNAVNAQRPFGCPFQFVVNQYVSLDELTAAGCNANSLPIDHLQELNYKVSETNLRLLAPGAQVEDAMELTRQ